jgi:sugar diacid utilization regulator
MNKYYFFLASGAIKREELASALDGLGLAYDINYLAENKGYVLADETFAVMLQGIVLMIHDDIGVTISFLAAHKGGPLEEKLLQKSLAYFPNQCLFLSDVLMKEFSFGDFSSLPLLSAEFKGVSHELLLTAGSFLRCGLNASLAAETLIIHRNTFNYRLAQFIDKTQLDIRDYHNALLLEIYFQLGNPH